MATRRQTKKVSATVKAYRKERSRVLATVRRYEKQGLYVDFVVPNIPKRITQASVRRLAKITPKKIQSQTYQLNEFGEVEASFYQFKKVIKKVINNVLIAFFDTLKDTYDTKKVIFI